MRRERYGVRSSSTAAGSIGSPLVLLVAVAVDVVVEVVAGVVVLVGPRARGGAPHARPLTPDRGQHKRS
jgi:hypothetical protein